MLRFGLVTIALALAIAQTACVSMSSMQTAQTLKPGESQHTVGGGTYNSEEKVGDTTVTTDAPYFEYSYRRGMGEKWDAGVKLTLIGSLAADAKYQLYDGEAFDFAVGGGLGYFNMKTGSGDNEVESTAYDLMLPIYASYAFSDTFATYITPRYVYRMVSQSGPDADGSSNVSLAGGAVGTKIGKEWGVYLEAAYQKALQGDFDLMQYNVAFFW